MDVMTMTMTVAIRRRCHLGGSRREVAPAGDVGGVRCGAEHQWTRAPRRRSTERRDQKRDVQSAHCSSKDPTCS